jgi:hypothetical protein
MKQKLMVKRSFVFTFLAVAALHLVVQPLDTVNAAPPEPTPSAAADIVTRLQSHQATDAGSPRPDGCLLEEATATPKREDQPISALDTRTFYPIADATVLEGYPNVNLGNTSDMWAGYDVCLNPDGEIARSLIRFDISSLPASDYIAEATLRIRLVSSCDYEGASRRIRTYRTTSSWSESSVTWNNRPGYGGSYGSRSIVHGAWGWYEFDVTNLVRAWHDGTYVNHGIMLRGPEVLGWRGFSTREGSNSYRPQLVIEHEPDTTPPSGSIIINGQNTYATSTSANLTLSASDSGSGVAEMRLSNSGYSWSAWQSYTTSKTWTLTSGDGTKRVYVQYRDNAGNTSPSYTDTIILDTTAPSSSASSPASTDTLSFTVNWSGTDGLSGIANYDVQYKVGSSGAWITWMTQTSNTSAVFGPTSPLVVENGETYYFQVRARDAASNLEIYPGGDGDTRTTVEVVFNTYLPLISRDA